MIRANRFARIALRIARATKLNDQYGKYRPNSTLPPILSLDDVGTPQDAEVAGHRLPEVAGG